MRRNYIHVPDGLARQRRIAQSTLNQARGYVAHDKKHLRARRLLPNALHGCFPTLTVTTGHNHARVADGPRNANRGVQPDSAGAA
tara:strand:+ start:243 stop:497 length:255 start_codon:yes stop_codon:yes gene_type:complete